MSISEHQNVSKILKSVQSGAIRCNVAQTGREDGQFFILNCSIAPLLSLTVRISKYFWSNLVEFGRIFPETASGTQLEFPATDGSKDVYGAQEEGKESKQKNGRRKYSR